MLSKVQGDKNSLRSTCRRLRLAVNARTTALTWTRPQTCQVGLRALPVFLPASLSASCPGIRQLDCGGREEGEYTPTVCLASMPPPIHTLICSHTAIQKLGPLSAWMLLQTLNCSGTWVAAVGPLAACTSLQTLSCNDTKVAELGPLAACTSLQALSCNNTRVAELGPLAACTSLQALYCRDTRVTHLGPLAACASLQTLDCSGTGVADLGPLATCVALAKVVCDKRVPREQVRLLQAACSRLEVSTELFLRVMDERRYGMFGHILG